MMRRLLAALAALCIAGSASAKVMVIWDADSDGMYTDGANPMTAAAAYRDAVTTLLDRFGAEYKVFNAGQVRTEWARLGQMVYNAGTSGAYLEQFDAVIHTGYNGGLTSRFATPCQPDSLLLNVNATVPQLLLLEDAQVNYSGGPTAWDNGASRVTWIATNGYQQPGGGSGNHEGEGSTYSADGGEVWFDNNYSSSIIKRASKPSSGMRVILGTGMNSVFNTIERTGNMTQNPDSVGRASLPDTMKVWEMQATTGSGVRITLATAFTVMNVDSVSSATTGVPNVRPQTNWPVLLCAIAHLDSCANGLVLGNKKKPGVGFVITHVGSRGPRNAPKGLTAADTNFVKQACDSLSRNGIPVVLAADPESLAVNAGDIAIWKRIGSARWTPFEADGAVDTTTLGVSRNFSRSDPIDVWGRFRNRAFYGDSLIHTVTGSDSSITQGILASRNNLASLVGGGYLSSTFIAPEFDYSPKQMRVGQNHNQLDSLMWAVRSANGTTLIVFTKGRDSDPQYKKTNPVGFLDRERSHTITLASKSGQQVTLLGCTDFPVYGSSKFIYPSASDTVPPYCDVACPGPSVVVQMENRFWNGFFPSAGRDYNFDSYDALGYSASHPFYDVRNGLYGQARSSICVLPAQLFGGGQLDYGYGHIPNSQTFPAMQGWLVFKHIANVAKAANRIAGRTIIKVAYPEDIEP